MTITRIILLFLFLNGMFSACDQLSRSDGSVASEAIEVSDTTGTPLINTLPVLLTNVDQLRLRKYPDLRSEMLTTFDENTPVYYTGEETDYEETIGSRKGTWKRIRTIDGELEGWVFGADYFVSDWLAQERLDSLHEAGKDIRIVNNLSRSEMNQLTGANFSKSSRGTRFSGYYEYEKHGNPQIITGKMMLRARQFDTDNKEVVYSVCVVVFDKGMPDTDLRCREVELPK